MTTHPLRLLLLAALLLPVAVPAAPAAVAADRRDAGPTVTRTGGTGVPPVQSTILVADGGVSIGKWLSGGRSRVVQLCVVAMSLALFIMMRKLT